MRNCERPTKSFQTSDFVGLFDVKRKKNWWLGMANWHERPTKLYSYKTLVGIRRYMDVIRCFWKPTILKQSNNGVGFSQNYTDFTYFSDSWLYESGCV